MKKKLLLLSLFAGCCLVYACKNEKAGTQISFLSPEAGTNVRSGQELHIKLDFGNGKADSVQYMVDSVLLLSKKDTSAVKINTSGMAMGNHLVTSRIFSGGTSQDVSSNIVVVASQAPEKYTFKVINTFPHDTASYTEGLEYHDGLLYESDGGYADLGGSSLRVVNPETGRIVKKVDIDTRYFAEGITLVGNKIIQLTYKEGVGFVYDKTTLKKLAEFPYQAGREGWGLYFDGKRILNTDGSNRIYFLDKDTYQATGSLEVFDENGPVNNLNELELINGKIYANVYTTDNILIIDPLSGQVEGVIDLSSLYPQAQRNSNADVLNGIAWDAARKRLFVTGKKWDKLFVIEIHKNPPVTASAN